MPFQPGLFHSSAGPIQLKDCWPPEKAELLGLPPQGDLHIVARNRAMQNSYIPCLLKLTTLQGGEYNRYHQVTSFISGGWKQQSWKPESEWNLLHGSELTPCFITSRLSHSAPFRNWNYFSQKAVSSSGEVCRIWGQADWSWSPGSNPLQLGSLPQLGILGSRTCSVCQSCLTLQASFNFMAAVTIYSDSEAPQNKVCHCFHCFPIYLPWMKGPDAMILGFWMVSFKSSFSLSSFTFIKRLFSSSSLSTTRVGSCAYLRLLIFLPVILIPAYASSFPAFLMMYSTYKLNKQGDNVQPWHTPFPIWKQSIVLCPVLTVASWPAYRFLRRLLRWSGIPISWRIFHSLLWSTQLKPLHSFWSYFSALSH